MKPKPGYELCPICNGRKVIDYNEKHMKHSYYEDPNIYYNKITKIVKRLIHCKFCDGTGQIDWLEFLTMEIDQCPYCKGCGGDYYRCHLCWGSGKININK